MGSSSVNSLHLLLRLNQNLLSRLKRSPQLFRLRPHQSVECCYHHGSVIVTIRSVRVCLKSSWLSVSTLTRLVPRSVPPRLCHRSITSRSVGSSCDLSKTSP